MTRAWIIGVGLGHQLLKMSALTPPNLLRPIAVGAQHGLQEIVRRGGPLEGNRGQEPVDLDRIEHRHVAGEHGNRLVSLARLFKLLGGDTRHVAVKS